MGRFDLTLFQLLAQTTEATTAAVDNDATNWVTSLQIIVVLAGLFILPFLFGSWWAKRLKMPDHGWRIGLIIFTLAAAGLILAFGGKPRLGIDLAGGVVFVAEIDPDTTIGTLDDESERGEGNQARAADGQLSKTQMEALVTALSKRLNPGGVKEITIRQYGSTQVEIIIPEATEAEAEEYWRLASTAGYLKFRIVANAEVNRGVFDLAKDQPYAKVVENSDGEPVAEWVRIGTETIEGQDPRPINVPDHAIVRRKGMQPYESTPGTLPPTGVPPDEVLVLLDEQNLTGTHVSGARTQIGNAGGWQVDFTMNSEGAKLMRWMTSENLTEPRRALGIILDDELLSAPAIQGVIADQGQITGNFSKKEVEFIVGVLNAGKLPAALRSEPISQNNISATLGSDLIKKGIIAILVSLVAILLFMAVYYRFAGLVACFALVVNLVLILAAMIAIGGTFTLPGLAGLVLTVGMSVDANVLIFERIREEMTRGSGMRMALRNGFAKATTTIVDANVTTLITAIVLYVIGTDQVKGFAVTLILGILASMFTAIFCAKVIFDIAERKRWIKQLRMMHIVGNTHINFMGKEKICATISGILILASIVGMVIRNEKMLAIDFMGGTSVQFLLKDATEIEDVRKTVNNWKEKKPEVSDVTVVGIQSERYGNDHVYQVDAAVPDVRDLQAGMKEEFGETLQVHELSYTPAAPTEPPTEEPAEGEATETPASETPASEGDATETGEESAPSTETPAEPPTTETPATEAPAAETPAEGETTPATPATEETAPAADDGASLKNQPRLHYVSFFQPAEGETTEEATEPAPTEGEAASEDTTDAASETAEDSTPAEETRTEESPTDPPATEETSTEAPAAEDSPTTETPATETPAPESTPSTQQPLQFGEGMAMDRGSELPAGADVAPASIDDNLQSQSFLTFDEPTTPQVLTRYINEALLENGYEEGAVQFQLAHLSVEEEEVEEDTGEEIVPEDGTYLVWDEKETISTSHWRVMFSLPAAEAEPVLATMQGKINSSPIWLQSNEIGSTVAGKTQEMAIAALLASLLGIVGYIWIRFQKVVYGLAAVVALVHDVLIVLGVVAFSFWLAPVLGFLQVEEFRINLPMVAAFLTLIGYSLNDTIVVFDRIREVKGKTPYLSKEIVNTSINQTLSRTLLTSGTTFLTVGILYFLGGEAIHGFAFALLVGIVVGTYSSVYIASPVLLWMSNYDKKHAAASQEPEKVLG